MREGDTVCMADGSDDDQGKVFLFGRDNAFSLDYCWVWVRWEKKGIQKHDVAEVRLVREVASV